MLEELSQPASATKLAPTLGLSRQKVNYHLRVLERLGLVELAELRQRRGFIERVMRRTGELVLDPGMMSTPFRPGAGSSAVSVRDRHAAEHLIQVAGAAVRNVARMQGAAREQGHRLLTFTIEAEVGFDQPADVHRFTDELATAVTEVSRRFHHPGGRRYAVLVAGHPAVAGTDPLEREADHD